MEEIKYLTNILLNSGGTVVMAVLFIIYLYLDRKDRKETEKQEKEERAVERKVSNDLIKEVSATNRNLAESLNLLKTSLDTTNSEFRQHDERAIKSFAHIREDLVILKERK